MDERMKGDRESRKEDWEGRAQTDTQTGRLGESSSLALKIQNIPSSKVYIFRYTHFLPIFISHFYTFQNTLTIFQPATGSVYLSLSNSSFLFGWPTSKREKKKILHKDLLELT